MAKSSAINDCVPLLKAIRADQKQADMDDEYLLDSAATNGSIDVVNYLLERGCNVTGRDSEV